MLLGSNDDDEDLMLDRETLININRYLRIFDLELDEPGDSDSD